METHNSTIPNSGEVATANNPGLMPMYKTYFSYSSFYKVK